MILEKKAAHDWAPSGTLDAPQREAHDMIATKLARIPSGDPAHADHWCAPAGCAWLTTPGAPGLQR
jgi:hypothetical protein